MNRPTCFAREIHGQISARLYQPSIVMIMAQRHYGVRWVNDG